LTDQAQPIPGQDPAQSSAAPAPTPPAAPPQPASATATPAAPPQPAPPSQGNTPWANDLNQAFTDEAQRAAVDQFLRSNVQPYVTKLEQDSRDALDLYNDLQGDQRAQAHIDVTRDLYGDEAAQNIQDYLELLAANPPEPSPAAPPQRDPEVQALIDRDKARQEKADYDQEFARVAAANEDLGLDPAKDYLKPFVAETGDFDEAVVQYRAWVEQLRAQYAPPTPAPDPAAQPAAPATLGTEGDGSTAPPVQKEYKSVNEAIDAFVEEERAKGQSLLPERPPTPAPPVAA
jgi:hypothetical protein